MSVLIECSCRRKLSVKNKRCTCGQDLDKLKRSGRGRFWINFKVEGKQRREYVGTSIEEARDADGKRRSQKRENRIFDILPGKDLTLAKVLDDFLDLETTKALGSYIRVCYALKYVKKDFGGRLAREITTSEMNTYFMKRVKSGVSKSSVTKEIIYTKTAIKTAVNDNQLDIKTLMNFQNIKTIMKRGENARSRYMTVDEYLTFIDLAPQHMRTMVIIAYNTGMRQDEVLDLRWNEIDLKKGFIYLPVERTKEGKAKAIPINCHVKSALEELPRPIHHNFVILNRGGGHLTTDGFYKVFNAACKDAGITYGREGGMTYHDLRGTWKMNATDAEVDKVYRDVILGHALTGMDAHYLSKRMSAREDLLTRAMDKYTAWLDAEIQKSQEGQTGNQKLTQGLTQ